MNTLTRSEDPRTGSLQGGVKTLVSVQSRDGVEKREKVPYHPNFNCLSVKGRLKFRKTETYVLYIHPKRKTVMYDITSCQDIVRRRLMSACNGTSNDNYMSREVN